MTDYLKYEILILGIGVLDWLYFQYKESDMKSPVTEEKKYETIAYNWKQEASIKHSFNYKFYYHIK